MSDHLLPEYSCVPHEMIPSPYESFAGEGNSLNYADFEASSSSHDYFYDTGVISQAPTSHLAGTIPSHPTHLFETAQHQSELVDSSRPTGLLPVAQAHLRREAPNLWVCLECGKKLKRKDRAVSHIYTHSGIQPWPCGGKCGIAGCPKFFISKDTLRVHRTKTVVSCQDCHRPITSKNMARHRRRYHSR